MTMQTLTDGRSLRALIAEQRQRGRRIGFVPTMGNLHAGHHSLLALARKRADIVVASVFVNPTQFGPSEDFSRYPRTPEADAAGLAAQGCDVLFLPTEAELYPHGAENGVRVRVGALGEILEGAVRPGHFDGVATVVATLFNIVQPDIAVFGQKDYQQLQVIRRMVSDLSIPIEIAPAPIVREDNGLAMSSRNQYLSSEQRAAAGVIHAALESIAIAIAARGRAIAQIEQQASAQLTAAGLDVDYVAIRRRDDLGVCAEIPAEGAVALIAARFGATRLIDNALIEPLPDLREA